MLGFILFLPLYHTSDIINTVILLSSSAHDILSQSPLPNETTTKPLTFFVKDRSCGYDQENNKANRLKFYRLPKNGNYQCIAATSIS